MLALKEVCRALSAMLLLQLPVQAFSATLAQVSASEPISALALKDLIDGSTIVLGDGGQKLYVSSVMTNALRRSSGLGPSFLRKHIRKDLIAEGTFIGVFDIAGKSTAITGVAGVGQDAASGGGVVFLMQSFPDDNSVPQFANRDRLFAVLLISESDAGFICRRSEWAKMLAFKGTFDFAEQPCRLVDGNFWLREKAPDAPIQRR